MLKITMPIYTATFPQDFLKVIFQQGGPWPPPGPPLESPMTVCGRLQLTPEKIQNVTMYVTSLDHLDFPSPRFAN